MGMAKSILEALGRRALRARLGALPFTVISNNCWGAHIYQHLGQIYQTPCVGVFFSPPCYLTLLSRFRWFLSQPLRFVGNSRHQYINVMRNEHNLRYPIGCLAGEVEVQFLHYLSESEAAEKWLRRSERVCANDAQLFFKFCDRDGCTKDDLAAFERLPLQHKVCFVSRPAPHLRSAVFIPGLKESQVPDGQTLSRISPRYFDAAGWINGSNLGHPRWWQPIRLV